MRVAIFETEERERDACNRLQPEHAVTFICDPLNERSVAGHSNAEIVSPFVNSDLSAGVLEQLPCLKLIATRSTGYDHIDLSFCAAHGIIVCNVPDYGDSTVAEHTFALLLAVARNLVKAVEQTRHGLFCQSGLRGFELRGKTLGVIGTGRIGRRVIEIANGFGMRVVAFDARPDEGEARRLGFHYSDFNNVLETADIVTLHVPSTPETIGLLSDREFGLIKAGAVLINTARGNIIDIPALVRALTEGRLRAAGLDVLPQEPLIREESAIFRSPLTTEYDLRALVANHVLLRFPNVIVTPHIAYNTDDAVGRIIDVTLENIRAFARGKPQNVVARH